MAKKNTLTDTEQVTAHIQALDSALAATVTALRNIILSTDTEIGEQIKWNSPSFYYTGAMKPFDPKEYKRDIVVMNLHRGQIMLVFPTGARISDNTGLLEGSYTDGRRIAKFRDLEDVQARSGALQTVIRDWLSTVER
jgi:hypothetical protein